MIAPIVIAIAGLAGLTSAQVGVGNQTIIPTSVDINTRGGWCRSQRNTCEFLCSKDWSTNECSSETLLASCVCADGSEPPLAEYKDSLAYHVCQAYIGQCVEGNATDPDAQRTCRNTNTCGTLDPEEFVASTTSRGSTPTSASTSGPSGTRPAETSGGTDAPSETPNAGAIVQPTINGMMFAFVAAMGLAGVGLVL